MRWRTVLRGAVALACWRASATQAKSVPVAVARVEELPAEWDERPFSFEGEQALLIRVPPPERTFAGLLHVAGRHFVAYSRTCTHVGCTVNLPNRLRELNCPCHGSRFDAASGALLDGPARGPLRRVALQARGDVIHALGWVTQGE